MTDLDRARAHLLENGIKEAYEEPVDYKLFVIELLRDMDRRLKALEGPRP